jgi:hypothetical protein
MRICLAILLLWAYASAEIGLSAGFTQGRSLQALSGEDTRGRVSLLALRPAFFVETDSLNHPLFLANDQVVFGLGVLTETAQADLLLSAKYQLSIPLYATYYLRFGNQAVGLGLNLNLLQLRHRNDVYVQGQQLGKHLFWRMDQDNSYMELGVLQLCAQGDYPDSGVVSFYDSTNFVCRYGIYLGGRNTL